MHVGRSFSLVGNELKLDIVLGSEVDLYTAIEVHGPIYSDIDLAKVYIRYIYITYHIKGMMS